LAKRLLNETSASEDAEKIMIGKLKMKCGAQFTNKLEGMLNDLNLASDLQKTFAEYWQGRVEENTAAPVDFSVQVLTTGNWPSYQTHEVSLIPDLQRCISIFQEFYSSRTKHRRLQWVHSLGSALVTSQFSKKHDLSCNTYQACLLLLFNNPEPLPFRVICSSLNLEDTLVKKLIGSFCLPKFRILKKHGVSLQEAEKDKTIKEDDVFEVNTLFSCNHRKIKIPTPVLEESHSKERVEEDRSIAIEAAIVRIMKARKALQYNQLVAEVISQLSSFRPGPKMIKAKIEHLIEREYMERSPDNNQMYRYLA